MHIYKPYMSKMFPRKQCCKSRTGRQAGNVFGSWFNMVEPLKPMVGLGNRWSEMWSGRWLDRSNRPVRSLQVTTLVNSLKLPHKTHTNARICQINFKNKKILYITNCWKIKLIFVKLIKIIWSDLTNLIP